jgi:hypothetical protein
MNESKPCLCGCGVELPAGSNRGEPKKFLNGEHKRKFERAARQVGALAVAKQAAPKRTGARRGLPVFDRRVSRQVFLAVVPDAKRLLLLGLAAWNPQPPNTPEEARAATAATQAIERATALGLALKTPAELEAQLATLTHPDDRRLCIALRNAVVARQASSLTEAHG